MAVSKRLRYEILRRDSHTCRYCGASAPNVPLRVDHVTPVALGGSDKPENLVTSCEPCNSGKSSATVDSAVVAGVSDDALRWATAMQQAADNLREQETPKTEYRDAFLTEWNRWHVDKDEDKKVPLDDDWKQSIERFRVAGIPTWMWADIVDIGMANKKVAPKHTFRYCCGIAWNKVTELQAEAKKIATGVRTASSLNLNDAVFEAALAVWRTGMAENEEPPTAGQEEEFRRSLDAVFSADLLAPDRIIQGAQHATYFGLSNISAALRDMDRDAVWRAWIAAWPSTWVRMGDEPWDGKFVGDPTEKQKEWVNTQIEQLLDANIYVGRLVRAASHAGAHKSTRIYSGLTEDELTATGVSTWQAQASELWRVAFTASGVHEPSEEETARLFANLGRIAEESNGDILIADVLVAASASGAYQDPDLHTCLTRGLSVFDAAACLTGGEN